MEINLVNAKSEINKENFSVAKTMLESLWVESNKTDRYVLYQYGKVLRKLGESIIFVEICREIKNNKPLISNRFIISMLCWCLYDSYIKCYTQEKDNFPELLEKANYIINNCKQKNAENFYENPYVITIIKVVKIYRKRNSINYKQIIKWLSYLNPDILSEDCFNFTDVKGKDRELASNKEFYYYVFAKAYEKTNNFEACIEICEVALKLINKFHYRNDIWIKGRLYYSKCMVQDNINEAINEYKKLAYSENHWFMYHKLSQVCFKNNKLKEGLLYSSKACICRFEEEKMINLMLDTAFLWQAIGLESNSRPFFQCSYYFRKLKGWSIPEELEYNIDINNIGAEKKPDLKLIRKISYDYIENIEGVNDKKEGKIKFIKPGGDYGFIKSLEGQDYYFKLEDVINNTYLKNGDLVKYEIIEYGNNKTRAIKVAKGDKNARDTY